MAMGTCPMAKSQAGSGCPRGSQGHSTEWASLVLGGGRQQGAKRGHYEKQSPQSNGASGARKADHPSRDGAWALTLLPDTEKLNLRLVPGGI